MKSSKTSALEIGIMFAICSFALTITVIVPAISVLPGIIIELVVCSIIPNDTTHKAQWLTIWVLSLGTILFLLLSIIYCRKKTLAHQTMTRKQIILLMLIFFFLIHSLGFYLYWLISQDFRGDGQLIFGASKSFPYTSFAFIFFSIFLDLTSRKPKMIQ